ncbi:MAG: SH3 domain-containing protein [bacterium]|nr:SH3 domain-containing protein [bacterium]
MQAMQVKVVKKIINIRKSQDLSSRVLMQTTRDTLLEVIESNDQWYKVVLPLKPVNRDKTGYVFHNIVEPVKEQTTPMTTEKVEAEVVPKPKAAVEPEVIVVAATGTGKTQEPGENVKKEPARQTGTRAEKPKPKAKKKDKLFIMGLGMLRINWASVKGNAIRFRSSDLGLPADLSTRERASFMVDGTFGHGKYTLNGHVNYDPENRITEPPLEFLVNAGNDQLYLSAGDYRTGVMLDSVFSRYYHPFRGGILGARTKSDRFGVEVLGGLSRGESGIEEFSADSGSGPYYLGDAPILRGSEAVYLVSKSSTNPDLELKRTPLVRNRDYFIDYDRGSLLFTYSLYPFDELGNPVTVLVSYQFESLVGRFSRAVFGLRAFASPLKTLKLSFSYIADADKNQSLGDVFKDPRGIYTFGANVDSRNLTFFGEFSFSSDPTLEKQEGFFGGGIWTINKSLKLFFNGWKLDSDFPTFANKQLQFGYSLFQIFPSYAERNIYLSPFQFTRNLGADLYPFSLARLSVDETEGHGFLEWERGVTKFSAGYGTREETISEKRTNTMYVSGFHNGEATKGWAKFGINRSHDAGSTGLDSRTSDVLLGARQRVKRFSHGDIIFQADYQRDWTDDFLDITPDTYHQTYSFMAEYLTGREGLFAGYRKELVKEKDSSRSILDADIYEFGIRRHIYKGFFVDSRFRQEEAKRDGVDSSNRIIALGAGLESKKFRAMARYETQLNETGSSEGRRKLWSLFLFGSPVKRMSISLRYYNQIGEDESETPFSVTERSEEQLSLRFLWRPWRFLNIYSQWRYDTNLELYPPLDRTRSNSLAEVHGVKLTLSKRLEFLANYKLIKIWGPIDNRKNSAAAEMGYLVFRHFRVGIGAEIIDFNDPLTPDANYRTTVGYFKLVAIY